MTRSKRIPPALVELLALALLALPMLLPLLRAAVPETHDGLYHYYRAIDLAWHLQHGDLFPRLAPDLGYGYGLPLFNFYAPLFYYPAALLILIGFDAALAVNLAVILTVWLAGWGMLRLGREWFGETAGWIAAAACLYSPYFLLDIYWRGAFPEVLGLALVPWGILFFFRLVRVPARATWRADWLGAAITTGLAVLAHNIGIIWSLPLFVAAMGAGWMRSEAGNRHAAARRVVVALTALVLGLALAAFFLLPAATESKWIQASRLTASPQRDYHNNFLAPAELVSLPRPYDPTQIAPRYPRSLGLLQLTLAAFGLLFIRREARTTRWLWLGLVLATGASAALTLTPSVPIWEMSGPMKLIQFPWRWLGPTSLTLALLTGYGAGALVSRAGRWKAYAFPLIAGLIIASNLTWAFATYNRHMPHAQIDAVREYERASGLVGLSTEGEFLPVWVTLMPAADSLAGRVVAGNLLARLRPESLPPGIHLESVDYRLTQTTARISAEAPGEVIFDWFYFPGWSATINGQPAPIRVLSLSGRIAVTVPAGSSEVRLKFGTTPVRIAGWGISLLALLGVIAGAMRLAPVRAKAQSPQSIMAREDSSFPQRVTLPASWSTIFWRCAALSAVVGVGLTLWRVGWVDRGLTPWMQMRFADSAVRGAGQATSVAFGDQLALIGLDAPPRPVPAGETAKFNLYWRALQPLTHDYSIAVHVLNEQGVLIAQADSQHPGGTPTSVWPLDRYDLDEHRIQMPAGTPPGTYRVLVGVYHIETGERLEAISTSGLPLPNRLFEAGTIEVARVRQNPAQGELGIRHPLDVDFGPVRLIGLDIGAASLRPGDDLIVTSYWKSTQAPQADYQARYELTDAAGATYPVTTALVSASYPTHLWTAQEILRGINILRVPAEAASGDASLTLALIDKTGMALAARVPVGTLGIKQLDRSFASPEVPVKVEATLGGVIELVGTSALPERIAPGGPIPITLDWQAIGRVAQRYTVFIHLLDASGVLRAQIDSAPLASARPTTSWLRGEYLSDPYRLATPPDLPAGTYHLEVGMYLPDTGERLPAQSSDGTALGTSIKIGAVDVSE